MALILKKIGKLLIAIDRPQDPELFKLIMQIVEIAQNNMFDEEIRAMLPFMFEGIARVYV